MIHNTYSYLSENYLLHNLCFGFQLISKKGYIPAGENSAEKGFILVFIV